MSKLGWHSLGASFACACGQQHSIPVEICHIGAGAAQCLTDFARARCGRRCFVLSDENTRQAAGEGLLSALSEAGISIREKTYGSVPFEATLERAEDVAAWGAEADCLVAIGSGTLCDLAKYAGHKHRRPVLLLATAASMNGYTSGIVALNVGGLKRTLPCIPALGVFADPEILATAPVRMTAAGIADALSKHASAADWLAAHLLRDAYHCSRAAEFVEGMDEQLLAACPGVARNDVQSVRAVIESLLLSGLSMTVAGSSAPASGGEHLISHYLDMRHAMYGTPNDLHGAQVGVATVHSLELWERILAADPETLDIEALINVQPAEGEVRRWIEEDWGGIAPEVLTLWREKALDRSALRNELERFRRDFPRFREDVQRELLPAKTVADAIRAAGGPTAPEELAAPVEEYRRALERARFLRNRFTVLDLAAELNLK